MGTEAWTVWSPKRAITRPTRAPSSAPISAPAAVVTKHATSGRRDMPCSFPREAVSGGVCSGNTATVPEQPSYRLPRTVSPVRYDVTLRPDLAAFTFGGSEAVTVKVHELINSITL